MSIRIHNVFDEEPVYRNWYQPFTFPAGEPHVQLDPLEFENQYVWVTAFVATHCNRLLELARKGLAQ